MVNVKFFKSSEFSSAVRCSIQFSGKMGFTESAIKKLDLDQNKSILIGKNEDDLSDQNLYMVVHNEDIENAFKVNKAGNYFYLNTKNLFDHLEYDYKNYTIMFNIVEMNGSDSNKMYKLVKKEVPRKRKPEDENSSDAEDEN